MKKTKESVLKRNVKPSTILSFRYSVIALIITLIMMIIIPKILNYAPESTNTPFDIQMSKISFTTQFLLIIVLVIIGIIALTKFMLKDVDKWFKHPEKATEKEIKKVREKCLILPYSFLAIEILIPFIVSTVLLSITGSHYPIMILKIILLLSAFALLLAISSFTISKSFYDELLASTYKEEMNLGVRISLKRRLSLLIFLSILSCLLLTSLVGYSASVIEQDDTLFNVYKNHLSQVIDTNKTYTKEELQAKLYTLDTLTENETKFLIDSNDNVTVISGYEVSDFVVEYTKQIAQKYDGRIYDSYGIDAQGVTMLINTDSGPYYVGILYNIYSETALTYLIINFVFLIVVTSSITQLVLNSLSKSLTQISDGFENIISNADKSTTLPVISNDEIGDLVSAFNKIQKMNTEHLETIQNNQNTLIERERLASLGQMVGGIAHNLKTPIFSISGGLEGLSDLIKEFDESIEDPNVTDQDMHEIANDMRTWITKLKGHTSYMSDVITTVKGQAVNLSEEQAVHFTVEELFQHIKILMQHEIKHTLSTLNITNNVPENRSIYGSINSLVQVINNLISNSIESYGKKETEKIINLNADYEESSNSIIISVKDFGPGLPKNVQEKLFKEMITTKGKDGTGLGLFMSYSNIKAHFKGDLSFETKENEGTTFFIKIPL